MAPHRDQPSKLWFAFSKIVDKCRSVFEKEFKWEGVENGGEIKYFIFPKNLTSNKSTVVTLGVGQDTMAEQKLKARMHDNVELFGADPIIEGNEKLYNQVGLFFPFAVGAEAGMSEASVYLGEGYVWKTVVHVDFIYFLKNIIKKKFIYALWMDNEHAEYGLFPAFFKGGDLETNGITICQFNMEVHAPNEKKLQLTHDFLFRIVEEERYVVLQSLEVTHLRLFFLNVENKECLNMY